MKKGKNFMNPWQKRYFVFMDEGKKLVYYEKKPVRTLKNPSLKLFSLNHKISQKE